MKIACISSHYPTTRRSRFYGGAEVAQKLFLDTLAGAGHHVVAIRGGTAGEADDQNDDVRVITLPFPTQTPPEDVGGLSGLSRIAWHARDDHNTGLASDLGSILDRERPDVVLTGNLHGLSSAVWDVAAARDLPIVHYLHDHYLTCHRSIRYRKDATCERSCLACTCLTMQRRHATRKVGAVIGNSLFTLEEHRRLGLFPNALAFELPPYAHPRDLNAAPYAPPEKLRLGFLGRLTVDKGLQRLIAARKRMLTASELFVGGPLEGAAVDARSLLAGDPDAHVLGLTDPTSFFKTIDLLVVPSLQNEPFGRVVMEARSHGVPVATSGRGALKDLTPPDWRFEPDDFDGFAAFLDRVCADRPALETEARRGRLAAEACTTDNIRAVFEAAITAARIRPGRAPELSPAAHDRSLHPDPAG